MSGQNVLAMVGKMAAGKNYICSVLEKEGFYCIDGDALIHQILGRLSEKIIQEFSKDAAQNGIELRGKDGTLNARELGRLLFSKKELLLRHEQIVYPEFIRAVDGIIEEKSHDENLRGVVVNAAVLYKTPSLLKKCAAIIYVQAPTLVRLFRARRRDGISLFQIAKRFWAQGNLFLHYKKFSRQNKIPIIKVNNFWGNDIRSSLKTKIPQPKK